MKPYEIQNFRDGYIDLVDYVIAKGKPVAPRGYKTWEVEDACFTLLDPADCLPVGVGRKLNPAIMAAEAVLLIGGISSPSLLVSVSDQFRRFLDGGDLHGGYGRRIRWQLRDAVRTLSSDPSSRQAVVQIWDPAYDSGAQVNDLPCTLGFNFRLRNDQLHMSATMRSSDVWLGAAYDVGMFCQLGWSVANALDVPLASYTHHAYSLHLYERNLEATQQLNAVADEPSVDLRGLGDFSESIAEIQEVARDIYNGVEPRGGGASKTEQWFIDTLKPYDRLTAKENFAS